MSKDYYKILGVNKNATPEEIKQAFRRLALQHHPDRGGDTAAFKEINEAYQVLSDETKRKQYDQFGTTFDGAGPGPEGFGGQGFNINMEDLGDLFGGFGDIFGGGRRTERVRGRDIEVDVRIDFKEAVFGADQVIELYKPVTCERCDGTGGEPGAKVENCPVCHGSGRVTQTQRTIFGVFQTAARCAECNGEGKRYSQKCVRCNGSGVTKETRKISVKIPAGIDNGAIIKVSGEGEAGPKKSPAGDLYLHVHVSPDPRFSRQGFDIHTAERINFADAVLGVDVSVETVDGTVLLKIPAGTQNGTVLKLKGKGIPHLRGVGRGDHLVTVVVDIPKKLNKKQKKLIEDLRDEGL